MRNNIDWKEIKLNLDTMAWFAQNEIDGKQSANSVLAMIETAEQLASQLLIFLAMEHCDETSTVHGVHESARLVIASGEHGGRGAVLVALLDDEHLDDEGTMDACTQHLADAATTAVMHSLEWHGNKNFV